jgi:hypothetical protein
VVEVSFDGSASKAVDVELGTSANIGEILI